MQIDREAVEKLLTLNDRQLKAIIQRLVAESGIDPAQFQMNTDSIESVRFALRNTDDETLQQIAEQYEANRKRGR